MTMAEVITQMMDDYKDIMADDSFIVCGFVDAMTDEYREELCFER